MKPNPWNEDKPWNPASSWVECQPYTSIVNEHITGNPNVSWFDYVLDKYILRTGTANILLLGSSEGRMEIGLRERGFKGRIVATDIADKAIARARAKCRNRGFDNIEHVIADLNEQVFTEQFDFIIAEGVLHHIENIELCLENLKTCLRPRGLLFAMEWVGAFRFQFPEIQQEWINAVLALLPRKYRPVET